MIAFVNPLQKAFIAKEFFQETHSLFQLNGWLSWYP